MKTQDILNEWILPEDQDAYARSHGYKNAADMCLTQDKENEERNKRLECNEPDDFMDAEIIVLARVTCEEYYTDDV